MAVDWSLARRTDACGACQHEFAIGETFQASLYPSQTGYERRDFCLNCAPPTKPPPVGIWKTRRPEPAAKRTQSFDRDALYGFFRRLEDDVDPARAQFRFVLALLLWRKKVLRLERTSEETGAEFWEFTAPRTGTIHRVPRPALDEAQLERLSTQLEQLMAGSAVELDMVAPDLQGEDRNV